LGPTKGGANGATVVERCRFCATLPGTQWRGLLLVPWKWLGDRCPCPGTLQVLPANSEYRDEYQHMLNVKAALLLEETSYPISEVGLMMGFSNANYFSKSFKKHFGKTPKSYQVELK